MLFTTSDPKVVLKEISKLQPLNYNQFKWWRRFDTKLKPLPRGVKFIDRIKNGEYEFSHYYWQWKLSELEINEKYIEYNRDVQKVLERMLRLRGKVADGQGYIKLIQKEFKI